MRAIAAALSMCLGTAAMADDFVVTNGPISDDDFYRLVACRAEPGQPCPYDFIRWAPEQARDLRIGFAPISPDYPPQLADHMQHSLDLAIRAINAIGADLTLVRGDKDDDLDIRLHLAPIRAGDRIFGTGVREVDGVTIGAGLVHLFWDDNLNLTQGVIVLAEDIPFNEAYPILLEEVTQALGLLTDVRDPYYETRSVFSEDSNTVTKHGAQDIMAILRHYPPT